MTTPDHRFYVTGGSLPPDNPSYVERKADRELYDALQLREFCYVLTARQMGKSSLMVRTAARLREDGVRVAVLDLTAIGQNVNAEQWYYSLLCRLGEQLDLEEELDVFWLGHERLGPLRRFMAAIEHCVFAESRGQPGHAEGSGPAAPSPEPPAPSSQRLVLFIDEIDAVRSLPFPTDEFFAAIRECYNRRSENPALRQLTFCLLGTAAPTDLIQDTRITPFNIGRRIELTDFTEGEALPLTAGLIQDGDIHSPQSGYPTQQGQGEKHKKDAARLLKRVLYWTGGHPYLTQRLCQAIADRGLGTSPRTTQQADSVCEDLFLARSAQEKDDNLIFVRERLLRSELDLAALLDLYARVRRGKPVPYDETDPHCSLLRLSGIVRVSERPHRSPRMMVRNRIYARVFDARWVAGRMPDAEVRRQRAAYRRGLARATTLSGVVVALIGALAATALRSAAVEKRERDRGDDLLYASQMNLAHLAYKDDYVRARRLLEQHRPRAGQPDRRDFVWRYLWRLCRTQARHTFLPRAGEVSSVAFSPDGKVTAAGGADGVIQLWGMDGKQLLATVPAHPGASAVAFSPDGRLLATMGRADGAVKLWNIASRPITLEAQFPGFRRLWTRIVFTPDGKTLIAGSEDDRIRLWDLETRTQTPTAGNPRGRPMGQRWRSIPTHAAGPLALSADGSSLAICGAGNDAHRISLWNITSRRVRRLPVSLLVGGVVQHVAFSPNGRMLVTATDTIRLWDAGTGRSLRPLPGHRGAVSSAEFSRDGRILASGGADGTIRLWDPASGKPLARPLQGHTARVISLAFSPGGQTLASTSSDGTTLLWDTDVRRQGEVARERSAAQIFGGAAVGAVAFSPDGKLLAEVRSGVVRFRSVTTGAMVGPAPLEPRSSGALPFRLPRGLAFAPDGKLLATGSPDGMVRIWDVPLPGGPARVIGTLRGHRFGVSHVGFAAGGVLVSGNGGAAAGVPASIRLWNVRSRQPLGTPLPGEPGTPAGILALSPDGSTLATGSPEQRVTLWDVASRRRTALLEGKFGLASLAFSPDGKRVAAGDGEGSVYLWDAATGRQTRRLVGHSGPVLALAFSPDSKILATGGMDFTLRLWNPEVDQEEATLTGHSDWVWSLAFSPDGNTLASGSPDGTVRLWRAATFAETDTPILPYGSGAPQAPAP